MINSVPKSFFKPLLKQVLFASYHASNSCEITAKLAANEDLIRYEKYCKEMYDEGEKIKLSTKTLQKIENGAWNAAWSAANANCKTKWIRFPFAYLTRKKFHKHFDQLKEYNKKYQELDLDLVHCIQYMCSDVGFYCLHIINGERNQAEKMADAIILHCLKICPKAKENEIREIIGAEIKDLNKIPLISLTGLIVAMLAIIISVTIPEVRCFIGLRSELCPSNTHHQPIKTSQSN